MKRPDGNGGLVLKPAPVRTANIGWASSPIHIIERTNRVVRWLERGQWHLIAKWCIIVSSPNDEPCYFFPIGPFDNADEACIFLVDYEAKNGRLEDLGFAVNFHPYTEAFPWIGKPRSRSRVERSLITKGT